MTHPQEPIDLDELQKLHEQATPGPWESVMETLGAVWGPDGDKVAQAEGNLALGGHEYQNASCIAASRNALPAIISSIRIAVEELKAYSERTLTVEQGRCRMAYHKGPDSPGMSFYEGEIWHLGDRAKNALSEIQKLVKI